jgi:hypothetical protein
MTPELGVIEGYFGRPWRHEDRKRVLTRLRELGFSWFHHAPKADAFLRRRWRERHPPAALAELTDLSAHCRGLGMRFGIGSALELPRFHPASEDGLHRQIRALDGIGMASILFDDTRGDVQGLAAKEADIVHAALAETRATRVVMCPTYYSDDRMLDVVFGERPAGYLEELGRRLDPRVGVYWTGEEICAREFSPGHLARVAEAFIASRPCGTTTRSTTGRGCRASLHLRGSPGAWCDRIGRGAHAINPACSRLTLIPAQRWPPYREVRRMLHARLPGARVRWQAPSSRR